MVETRVSPHPSPMRCVNFYGGLSSPPHLHLISTHISTPLSLVYYIILYIYLKYFYKGWRWVEIEFNPTLPKEKYCLISYNLKIFLFYKK